MIEKMKMYKLEALKCNVLLKIIYILKMRRKKREKHDPRHCLKRVTKVVLCLGKGIQTIEI